MSRQEDQNRYNREHYQKLKEQGICVNCACRPVAQGKSECQECLDLKKEYNHRYWKGKSIEANSKRRNVAALLKIEVISYYGGKCTCCGETEISFLVLDHINGGGNKHRRDTGITGGVGTYRWIKRNRYPDGFQVLCCNCNQSKGANGVCAHQSALAIK